MSEVIPAVPPTPVEPPPAPTPTTIQLTQEELQGRINAAVAQASKRTKDELAKELEATRSKLAGYEQKEAEAKGDYAKALAAQADSIRRPLEEEIARHKSEAESYKGKYWAVRVDNALVAAAGKLNATEPDDTKDLFLKRFEAKEDDSGRIFYVNRQTQQPVFKADGTYMDADGAMQAFLSSRQDLVKPVPGAGGSGAGSGASRMGKPTPQTELDALKAKQAALAEEYQKTRHNEVLTQHRLISNKIRELEQASKSAA